MRIELPSGGWWEIQDRPLKWRVFRDVPFDETRRDTILAAMTTAWSFPETPSAESIGEREGPDVLAALAVVNPLYVIADASKKSPSESADVPGHSTAGVA